MEIKPTFDRTYLVRYSRGNDVQTTELVNTDAKEVLNLVLTLFSDRMVHPHYMKDNLATRITVKELDNVKKWSRQILFQYTKNGHDFDNPYMLVKNFSPRQLRIELENQIKKQTV